MDELHNLQIRYEELQKKCEEQAKIITRLEKSRKAMRDERIKLGNKYPLKINMGNLEFSGKIILTTIYDEFTDELMVWFVYPIDGAVYDFQRDSQYGLLTNPENNDIVGFQFYNFLKTTKELWK